MIWQKHTQSHRNDDEYTAMAANGMNCKQTSNQIKFNKAEGPVLPQKYMMHHTV